jgi:hypothetical protein
MLKSLGLIIIWSSFLKQGYSILTVKKITFGIAEVFVINVVTCISDS